MDYRLYCFPTADDGSRAIEKALLDLEKREREGEPLDQVEKDWIDYANLILR